MMRSNKADALLEALPYFQQFRGKTVVVNGQPSKTPIAKLKKVVKKSKFTITIHLHSGMGEYSILTTDLTEEYVRINKGE